MKVHIFDRLLVESLCSCSANDVRQNEDQNDRGSWNNKILNNAMYHFYFDRMCGRTCKGGWFNVHPAGCPMLVRQHWRAQSYTAPQMSPTNFKLSWKWIYSVWIYMFFFPWFLFLFEVTCGSLFVVMHCLMEVANQCWKQNTDIDLMVWFPALVLRWWFNLFFTCWTDSRGHILSRWFPMQIQSLGWMQGRTASTDCDSVVL